MPVAIQTYNQSGIKVDNPRNFSSIVGQESSEHAADLGDNYFRGMNAFINSPQRKGIVPKLLRSPGTAGAVCEVIAGGFLWRCFKGPATLVNWCTSIGEFINVAISESDKISKPIKEELLASIQIGAGVLGFGGFLKERLFTHKENDYSNIPILEKIGLSASYLLNTFFMVTGAIEKSLLSMVCNNRDPEKKDATGSKSEYRDCLTSAQSDLRCTIECGLATLIPWVMDFGPVKFILDLLMPYQAIRTGLDTYVDRFKDKKDIFFIPKKLQTKKTFELMEFINDPRTLLGERKKRIDEKFTLLWPFNNFLKFFIGTESDKKGEGASGFRNYCIKPFYKVLGALAPDYYLNNDGNIVVKFTQQKQKEQVVAENEEKQSSSGSSQTGEGENINIKSPSTTGPTIFGKKALG